jgi:serine/threonine protein kinase
VVREENLHIFKQMVEALQHVHSKHIIHRDLKVRNYSVRLTSAFLTFCVLLLLRCVSCSPRTCSCAMAW